MLKKSISILVIMMLVLTQISFAAPHIIRDDNPTNVDAYNFNSFFNVSVSEGDANHYWNYNLNSGNTYINGAADSVYYFDDMSNPAESSASVEISTMKRWGRYLFVGYNLRSNNVSNKDDNNHAATTTDKPALDIYDMQETEDNYDNRLGRFETGNPMKRIARYTREQLSIPEKEPFDNNFYHSIASIEMNEDYIFFVLRSLGKRFFFAAYENPFSTEGNVVGNVRQTPLTRVSTNSNNMSDNNNAWTTTNQNGANRFHMTFEQHDLEALGSLETKLVGNDLYLTLNNMARQADDGDKTVMQKLNVSNPAALGENCNLGGNSWTDEPTSIRMNFNGSDDNRIDFFQGEEVFEGYRRIDGLVFGNNYVYAVCSTAEGKTSGSTTAEGRHYFLVVFDPSISYYPSTDTRVRHRKDDSESKNNAKAVVYLGQAADDAGNIRGLQISGDYLTFAESAADEKGDNHIYYVNIADVNNIYTAGKILTGTDTLKADTVNYPEFSNSNDRRYLPNFLKVGNVIFGGGLGRAQMKIMGTKFGTSGSFGEVLADGIKVYGENSGNFGNPDYSPSSLGSSAFFSQVANTKMMYVGSSNPNATDGKVFYGIKPERSGTAIDTTGEWSEWVFAKGGIGVLHVGRVVSVNFMPGTPFNVKQNYFNLTGEYFGTNGVHILDNDVTVPAENIVYDAASHKWSYFIAEPGNHKIEVMAKNIISGRTYTYNETKETMFLDISGGLRVNDGAISPGTIGADNFTVTGTFSNNGETNATITQILAVYKGGVLKGISVGTEQTVNAGDSNVAFTGAPTLTVEADADGFANYTIKAFTWSGLDGLTEMTGVPAIAIP